MNKFLHILIYMLLFPTFSLLAQSGSKGMKIISQNDKQNSTSSEQRLALVIGNKEYDRKDAQLTNPANDANDVANALEELGFTVIKKINLSKTEFEKTIDEFGAKLTNYQVGLFYFSGHGLQYKGENYFVPTDANMSSEPQIEYQCVPLGRLLSAMEGANTLTNLVILDACRDAPFKKSWASRGSGKQGLTNPNNPPGTSVVFATSAGSTASDNPGERNGLFTGELLKFIKTEGRPLSQILYDTKSAVFLKSQKQQMPEEYNKLFGDFYFKKSPNVAPSTSTVVQNTIPNPLVSTPNNNIVNSKNIFLQGSSFKMGLNGQSPDERPVHEVKLNNFWIAKYEVSVSEWKEFCNATKRPMPRKPSWEWQDNEPIVGISWYDAIDYCNWLSSKSGLTPAYQKSGKEVEWDITADGFRLPTEAEWEFAARGGKLSKNTSFSGTEDPKIGGWYNENSEGKPHKIGTKIANEAGLYDMSGNVWEWCWDWHDETYYRKSPKENPIGPSSGTTKVLRGGSWLTNDIRVTLRIGNIPEVKPFDCGLRVVRNQ